MSTGAGHASVDGTSKVLVELINAMRHSPPQRAAELIAEAASGLGAAGARVWFVDHQQRSLIDATLADPRASQPIDGSAAGRAFITSEVVVATSVAGNDHMWVPLIDDVARLGVLELELHRGVHVSNDVACRLAALAGAELVARGRYSDDWTILRRRQPMSVAAEMQWQALPPLSFSADDVSVAGMLEPAYDTGGDTFDYAHGRNGLFFTVLDAVGHDLGSALVSTLALASYRNARRSGEDLEGCARAMDVAIRGRLGNGWYCTGQLGHLDPSTGIMRWLNAGHPLPLLIRAGHVIDILPCRPRLPFGLSYLLPGRSPEIATVELQAGDSVLLYTDGVIEARHPGGEEFGLERLKDFLERAFAAALPAPETVRRLSNAILDHHRGDLSDDATTLLVTWRPNA